VCDDDSKQFLNFGWLFWFMLR